MLVTNLLFLKSDRVIWIFVNLTLPLHMISESFLRGIQSHIRQNEGCRLKYSKKALNDLMELCEAQKKRNISDKKAKNYQNLKLQTKPLVERTQSGDSSLSKEVTNITRNCNGCSRQFAKNAFMKHLSHQADCKGNMLQLYLPISCTFDLS